MPAGDGGATAQLVRVVELRDIAAHLPRVRLADPDSTGVTIELASLAMTAAPFRPPEAVVTGASGTLRLAGDSAWWRGVRLALPGTRLTSDGGRRAGGSLDLAVRADTLSLADWRWLYPRLPAEGGGRLALAAALRGSDDVDLAVRELSLRSGAAVVEGGAAVRAAGGVRTLHDTELRFEHVGTRLVEQLVAGFDAPRDGEMSGRLSLAGRTDSLAVDGDVAFDDARAGRSRVAAVGEVGIGEAAALRARGLRVTLRPLQLALVPAAPVGGALSGEVTVDGSTAAGWRGAGSLAHSERGARSRATGRAAVGAGANPAVDADLRLLPLSLATLGRLAPALGLRGSASGPLRVTGRANDLGARTRLELAGGGGTVALDGRLRRAAGDGAGTPSYELTAAAWRLDAAAVSARAPRTMLSGTATLHARGTLAPERARAELALQLAPSVVGDLPVDTVALRARAADGLLSLDTVEARALGARASAGGTFGLAAGREGRLTYAVRLDSIDRLRRWIGTDSGVVLPRPLRQARPLARARADSARLAQATRIERLATGGPDVELPAYDAVPPLPRDSLAGTLAVEGQAAGSVRRLSVRGRATGRGLVALGRAARALRAEYAIGMDRDAPPGDSAGAAAVVVGAVLDSVQAEGFAFEQVDARLAARDGGGATVELAVRQDDHREYLARAELLPRGGLALRSPRPPAGAALRLDTLGARFGAVRWGLARRGAEVRWAPGRVEVDSLELRSTRGGRLFAHGQVADTAATSLRVEADGVELADVAAALQADTALTGVASLRADLEGTPADPRLRAEGALAQGAFRGVAVPNVELSASYGARRLDARAELRDSAGAARPLATVEARLPVDLALRRPADAGPRLSRGDSIAVDVRADSLPLERVPSPTTAVGEFGGRLQVALGVRGTLERPALAGGLRVDGGAVTVRATGARLTDVAASLRAAGRGDTVVVDSIVGRSHGTLRVDGHFALPELLRPVASLRVAATDLQVLDNDNGQMRLDLAAGVSGPPDDILVDGRARLRNSTLAFPGPGRKLLRRYAPGDPRVFVVFDTAPPPRAYPVPPRPDTGPNFRARLQARIESDNWFRTPPDANVEYFSAGGVTARIDRRRGLAAAEGVVRIRNGKYVYLARAFELERGSLSLSLTPGVLPHFQLAGTHEIWLPGREPMEIRLLNSGPSRGPRITLETSAVFPMTQRDVVTHLSLGRAWTSLLQQSGTSLSGDGPLDGFLTGEAGAMARRGQTAAALGVLLHDLSKGTVRSMGSDLFSATPTDLRPELANSEAAAAGGTTLATGWLLNRRTLATIEFRPMAAPPGLRLEHRMRRGLLLEGGLEPRFLLRPPRGLLDREPARTVAVGAILWKEWEW